MVNPRKNYSNFMSDMEIMNLYIIDKTMAIDEMTRKLDDYIRKICWKIFPTYCGKEMDDLLQEGRIGIMEAMERYDPKRSAFISFCWPFVVKRMNEHTFFLSGESSPYYARIHIIIMRVKSQIEVEGKEASVETIMEATGMSRRSVEKELRIDLTKVSIDSIPDQAVEFEPSEEFVINNYLIILSQEDAEIVKTRVLEELPFTKIAEKYGVSTHMIKKRYEKSIDMLRKSLAV